MFTNKGYAKGIIIVVNPLVFKKINFIKLLVDTWFVALFIAIMWAVFLLLGNGSKVIGYGILPRTLEGLWGVVCSPFIHADWEHLAANTVPLLILGILLFTQYKPLAFKTFLVIWLVSGVYTWLSGRPNYHVGASGIAYGLWAFVMLSGFLRKKRELIVLSFLVAFLYGGFFWGLFPYEEHVSYEGHVSGLLAGVLCAIAFLREGPQRPIHPLETEPDTLPDDPEAPWNLPDENAENPNEYIK